MKTQYDVCVVGGGAAGMAAAIAAAEGGNTVCIIDKNKKLGKKLYATGNGRCNLANTDMKWSLSFVFRNVSEISAYLSGRATIA